MATVQDVLSRVENKDLSIPQMMKESRKIKDLKEVQKAFMDAMGAGSWEEAQEKYPTFTTADALDEFVGCASTPR